MTCHHNPLLPCGWRKVVFASDLDDESCCPCGHDYADDCLCPGPTEDGYEYEEVEGIMYGRRLSTNPVDN